MEVTLNNSGKKTTFTNNCISFSISKSEIVKEPSYHFQFKIELDDLDEKLRRVFDEKELHDVMLFPPMAGSGICGVFIPQKLLTRLDILNDA